MNRQKIRTKMFRYFNDGRNQNIGFRQFMIKYATILRSELSILGKIIFELYRELPEGLTMSQL